MRDGVVGEAAQIAARRLRKVLGLFPDPPAVVDAADQDRQRAARMRQIDLQVGMAVEHPAEDQVAGGDRGVDRVAEQIAEVEALHALAADGLDRMQEHWQPELLDPGEDRFEQGVVEVAIVDVGAHVDAAHARHIAHAIELVDGPVRVKHGQGREHDEAVRMGLVRDDRRVVPRAREPVRQVGIGPVQHRRGERERVHAHALGIHVGEALLDIDEFLGQWPGREHRALDHEGVVGGHHLIFEARTLAGDKIEIGLREIVRVRVDGADPGRRARTGALRHGAVGTGRKHGRGEPSLQNASARWSQAAAASGMRDHGLSSRLEARLRGFTPD